MKNELLAKYILGEANTKEGQRVEEWLGESEDHQREFRQLKRRITNMEFLPPDRQYKK